LKHEKLAVVKKIRNRDRFRATTVLDAGIVAIARSAASGIDFLKSGKHIAKNLTSKLDNMQEMSNALLLENIKNSSQADAVLEHQKMQEYFAFKTQQSKKETSQQSGIQYISGTHVYYGSEVALQGTSKI